MLACLDWAQCVPAWQSLHQRVLTMPAYAGAVPCTIVHALLGGTRNLHAYQVEDSLTAELLQDVHNIETLRHGSCQSCVAWYLG